jgi:hypothetical protein
MTSNYEYSVISLFLVFNPIHRGRGWSGRTDHDQQHCYHHVPTVNQRLLLQLMGSR